MMAKAGLKTAQAFALVRLEAEKNGTKFISPSVILQVRASKEDKRIGYIVSRKCGNAVHRNRIKRRLRAAMAQACLKTPMATGDFVLIGRKKAYECSYNDLLADINTSLQKYNERKTDE